MKIFPTPGGGSSSGGSGGSGGSDEFMTVYIDPGSSNQTISGSDQRIAFDAIFESSNSGSNTTNISLDTTTNVGELTIEAGTYLVYANIYPAGAGNGTSTVYLEANSGASDFQASAKGLVDYHNGGDPKGRNMPVVGVVTVATQSTLWLQSDQSFSGTVEARREWTQLTILKVA